MAYPTDIDAFGTPAGTSLLTSPDHSLDHRELGSAVINLENKVGLGSGSAAANQILVGSGAGTSAWGTVWNGGSITNTNMGSPRITGGTASAFLLETSTTTGGTITTAMLGTNTITGGTITTILVKQRTIGSAAYTGTIGGTITLDPGTASRLLVNLPDSAGSVTLAITNAVANGPFMVEVTEGTSGLGTIGWFSTIKWPGNAVPPLTPTASKKDSFGFIPTSGTTFDAYILGQNL